MSLFAVVWVISVVWSCAVVADRYSELLASSAVRHGPQKKEGMLPVETWSVEHFNRTQQPQFQQWLELSLKDMGAVPKVPPLTHTCGVWVNHAYKVIFVRNKKAASTSIVHSMGNPCREGADLKSRKLVARSDCMDKLVSPEPFTRLGLTPDQAWKDYFVFGVARNPWSKAASGFDYSGVLNSREECFPHPDFRAFCQDPMTLGRECYRNYSCCAGAHVGKFMHNEPAARCFQTADGKSVVDHILRYEHLEEDFAEVIQILNQRRSGPLKELTPDLGLKTKGILLRQGDPKTSSLKENSTWLQFSERHVDKYRKCGEDCVNAVAEFYKEDVDFFGFKVPVIQ